MKRAIFLLSLIFIYGAVSRVAFSQSDAKPKAGPDARKACAFSIVGLWRSDSMTAGNPIVFDFSPEGWVTLLGHSADALPREFEVITAVNYKLDNPAGPERIEFTATRGNDVFLRGTTSMQIALYSNDSFTTVNPESGQQAEWVKVQTHRYFLTFAARSGMPQQGGPVFAMWTTLDGRQPNVEVLGIQISRDPEGKALPVFGPIPDEVYNQITEESDEDKKKSRKGETALMRLELTASEFERTHKVFAIWDNEVKSRSLPQNDPYLNVMEFMRRAVEPLNQCGEKLKLDKVTRTAERLVTKDDLRLRPLEFIRAMRKKNEDLHVSDRFFPWGWRPVLQFSGQ